MAKNKRSKRLHGLSMQIVPFSEVKELGIPQRVKKILSLILNNKIVVLQGRLRSEEEARLIEDTMALVDHVKNFKGIELAVIEPNIKNAGFFVKMKYGLAKSLIGDTSSMTVIGPASVIKEIKRDPKQLELFFG